MLCDYSTLAEAGGALPTQCLVTTHIPFTDKSPGACVRGVCWGGCDVSGSQGYLFIDHPERENELNRLHLRKILLCQTLL